MLIATAEEKVPLEAKKEPFMVCGFLGLFWNFCYGTEDHLGSTRMVLAENGEIKQALMYQPYGTIAPVAGIPGTGTDPLRQKFTTKEFDEDGDANSAPGIQAYHFGARMYDSDLGFWQSRDPAEEFFNPYAYHTNPLSFVDPTGEDFGLSAAIVGAIIAAAAATAAATANAAVEKHQTGYWDWGNYLKDVFIQSNISGAIGFVTGGVGAGISSGVSTAIQGATGGTFWGAVGGGAAAGAFSGATGYTMNYTLQATFGYQEWGTSEEFFTGLGKAALIGGATGAVASAFTYGLDRVLGRDDYGYMFMDSKTSPKDVRHLSFHFGEEKNPIVELSKLSVKDLGKYKNSIDFGSAGHLGAMRPTSGGVRITGVNKTRALLRYDRIIEKGYNKVYRNCAQTVSRSLGTIHPGIAPAPSMQISYWLVRQAYRSFLGL